MDKTTGKATLRNEVLRRYVEKLSMLYWSAYKGFVFIWKTNLFRSFSLHWSLSCRFLANADWRSDRCWRRLLSLASRSPFILTAFEWRRRASFRTSTNNICILPVIESTDNKILLTSNLQQCLRLSVLWNTGAFLFDSSLHLWTASTQMRWSAG